MDSKDIRLAEIKKHNPTLYSKVVNGSTTLQDAYNEMMSEINNTREYKGKGTKGLKSTLEQEFQIVQKRYKPSLEDWLELLKKQFPFTYNNHLKD